MIGEDFIWVEKYRPSTVEETILPSDLKSTFQKFVDNKNIPNLILSGDAGVGKTTIARAMLEELECDYIVINGSLNGNIDTLRNEIMNFASSVSLMGGRKYVILDEADYLNANSTQPALRNFMEEFSRNCGFILTCNFLNRLIKPLQSRASVINFKIQKKDMAKLAGQFFDRVKTILEAENIEYEPSVVAEVITKHFPDWRRVLNELQRYSATGKIDSGILANLKEVSLKELIDFMKDKDFTKVRKWIGQNSDSDQNSIYRNFYDNAVQYFQPKSIPQLVLALGKYQYQAAFCADPEINLSACMVEVMCECELL
jgi:DNA polymerase III delta prime subunit